MMLSENPYYQQWVSSEVARMSSALASKEALTYGATRIPDLSTHRGFSEHHALTLDAERVTTNLMRRFRKQG
jgi:hypothetical protein